MPEGKDLGLNRSPSAKSCRIERSSERMIANIAFANYRSCRASSTGSMRTQFLVGTGRLTAYIVCAQEADSGGGRFVLIVRSYSD